MNPFNYYMQANIALIVVATGYHLLLKNEKHFHFNRAYLLTGIAAALLFPLITVQSSVSFSPSIGQSLSITLLPEFFIDGNKSVDFNYGSILKGLYFCVTALLLVSLVYKVSNLLAQAKKINRFTQIENFRVIENQNDYTSFSFFRLIFISTSYSVEERQHVISHEIVHAKKLHSIDIILTEFLKIFFWFNPAVYILKKQFTSIHEFQADEEALKKCDANQYCNLLARIALQSADYPIANHFNNSLTLKRITMIKNAKERLKWWRIASSIAIIGGLFLFVSCKQESEPINKISPSDESVPAPSDKISPSDKIFSVVDESASPANGWTEYYGFIGGNLRYPEQARKAGIEGKVFVQFTINKDGSLSDVTVLKGIGAGCDKAALEVISSSPKWKPGKQAGLIVRQRYTIPIVFKLG